MFHSTDFADLWLLTCYATRFSWDGVLHCLEKFHTCYSERKIKTVIIVM